MILYMYIAPGQGQITSDDKISMLIKSFCYFDHFFNMILQTVKKWETKNHFCTLRAGTDNSNGVNFQQHRKLLSLCTFAVSFRTTALNSDFT